MALFVFVGTGAAVFFSDPKSTDFTNAAAMISNTRLEPLFNVITTNSSFGVVTALAFGIGIMVAAFSIGHVSGCHLNPAVTISLLLSGNCGIGQAIANIVAQCGGACIGSLLLWGTSDLRSHGLGANSVGDAYSVGNAVLGEIVCTFLLCYVVHMTAVDKNSPPSTNGLAPIAIGFAVFLGHAVLIPLDGCSINPARSFGPALVANRWKDFWVFVVGPIAGAILSVPMFFLISQPWEAKRDAKGRVVEGPQDGTMKIESAI
jgi:MIP family channel proteins